MRMYFNLNMNIDKALSSNEMENTEMDERAIIASEDGEPPLTPAEQAFNSYSLNIIMGNQRPTQADNKPKEDKQ